MMFKQPLSVSKKAVPHDTSYEKIISWWETDTEAQAARETVRENCVCFIQLGGHANVFICVPDSSSAAGMRYSVQPISKARGKFGTVTMLIYS